MPLAIPFQIKINYWIITDTIIFKPEFNNELDGYIEIISQYKKLIFSNYNEPEITIKTNNIYKDWNILNLYTFLCLKCKYYLYVFFIIK